MERKPRRGGPSGDPDGIRVVYHERTGVGGAVLLVAVVVSSALVAFLLLQRAHEPVPTSAPEPGARVVVNKPARIRVRAQKPRVLPEQRYNVRPSKANVAPTSTELEGSSDVSGQAHPDVDAREFIAALRESGETAGLAAFSPPGTHPPRSGVIVPADYELPEGFARHYQTTDDGRQLAPVLVVAPGYEIVDDAGDPVALMDDRIVPPEYAPPDLPVQMLDVPSERLTGEDAH